MTKVILKTSLDGIKLLNTVKTLAELECPYDQFYRGHPGFNKWVEQVDPYTYVMDADIVNLKMMELLQMFKCTTFCEGGCYEDGDDYCWEYDDWKEFMDA